MLIGMPEKRRLPLDERGRLEIAFVEVNHPEARSRTRRIFC